MVHNLSFLNGSVAKLAARVGLKIPWNVSSVSVRPRSGLHIAGWCKWLTRRTHIPETEEASIGSNPIPATNSGLTQW